MAVAATTKKVEIIIYMCHDERNGSNFEFCRQRERR